MIQIRPWQVADTEPLLAVFRKNVPTAFGESEVAEYADFLTTCQEPYVVAEHEGRVVGACGHSIRLHEQKAHIVWIFADPALKGLGIGTALMRYNLLAIRQYPEVTELVCRTSQVAYAFFERFGFQLQYTQPDYWVPGLDLYYMTVKPDALRGV